MARATRSPAGSSWRSPGSISRRWISVARAGDEPRGAGRVETLSLAPEQRARRVPDVVGQDPADETLGARLGRDERVRLHARGSGATPASAGGAAAASRASARIAWRLRGAGRCRRSGRRRSRPGWPARSRAPSSPPDRARWAPGSARATPRALPPREACAGSPPRGAGFRASRCSRPRPKARGGARGGRTCSRGPRARAPSSGAEECAAPARTESPPGARRRRGTAHASRAAAARPRPPCGSRGISRG